MTIGLSTYSFFWQWHETAERPIGLPDMLAKTADWGVSLFQVCDYPPVSAGEPREIAALATAAHRRGIALEVGTRGVDPGHLATFLGIAQRCDAVLVRSMIPAAQLGDAVELLRASVPAYERAGVRLALETYEQVPTARLVEVVDAVNSPCVGVCLDPANSVAALETPVSTIEATADKVLNLHVKDFAFSRRDGWVGFTFAGAKLGEGLLDYDAMIARVRPDQRGINQIIEHWLVWQGDSATTCALEDTWTRHNLAYLRERSPQSTA